MKSQRNIISHKKTAFSSYIGSEIDTDLHGKMDIERNDKSTMPVNAKNCFSPLRDSTSRSRQRLALHYSSALPTAPLRQPPKKLFAQHSSSYRITQYKSYTKFFSMRRTFQLRYFINFFLRVSLLLGNKIKQC